MYGNVCLSPIICCSLSDSNFLLLCFRILFSHSAVFLTSTTVFPSTVDPNRLCLKSFTQNLYLYFLSNPIFSSNSPYSRIWLQMNLLYPSFRSCKVKRQNSCRSRKHVFLLDGGKKKTLFLF